MRDPAPVRIFVDLKPLYCPQCDRPMTYTPGPIEYKSHLSIDGTPIAPVKGPHCEISWNCRFCSIGVSQVVPVEIVDLLMARKPVALPEVT